jgi:hypothetical protein
MPAKTEPHVHLLDEELAGGPEGHDDHRHAADQAEPPKLVRVPLREGLNQPEDAYEHEQKPRMSAVPDDKGARWAACPGVPKLIKLEWTRLLLDGPIL